jgi:hypothetical protein
MAQSRSARNDSRHDQDSGRNDHSSRDRDTDEGGDRNRQRDSGRERDDDRSGHDRGRRDDHDCHDARDQCDEVDRRDYRHGDRHERMQDLDIEDRRHGIDLEIDMDRHGRRLDIEIEIGSFDLDLELDRRLLQPDDTSMAAVIGGEGNAVGENTLVDADIFSRLVDNGSVTVAFGTATFTAAAASGDGMVFAAADTFADVAGADVVLIFTDELMSDLEEGSLSAFERSTTRFVAIDFEEFDLLGGPIVLNSYDAAVLDDRECSCECDDAERVQIEGNVAQLDVDATAASANTLVDVSSSVLTVDDQLSSVSAVTVTAVG